jgi:hypothetical protein
VEKNRSQYIDRPIILLTGWPLILLSGLAYQCLSDCNRCACSEAEIVRSTARRPSCCSPVKRAARAQGPPLHQSHHRLRRGRRALASRRGHRALAARRGLLQPPRAREAPLPRRLRRMHRYNAEVLDHIFTDYFYKQYPECTPELLTDLRSASVNNNCYAHAAVKAGLHKHSLHSSSALHKRMTDYIENFKQSCTFFYYFLFFIYIA